MNKEKNDVLDDFSLQVKKIEEKADLILEEAQNKKNEIIANAKTDSLTLLNKKRDFLENKKNEKIASQKKKIDQEKELAIKENSKELILAEKKARKNIPKAVDFVLQKLEQRIDDLK